MPAFLILAEIAACGVLFAASTFAILLRYVNDGFLAKLGLIAVAFSSLGTMMNPYNTKAETTLLLSIACVVVIFGVRRAQHKPIIVRHHDAS